MNRIHLTFSSTLLAIAAVVACGSTRAEPRDPYLSPPQREPDTPETREARRLQKAQDMDVWLRRLVGRFRIEGVSYVDGNPPTVKSAKGMEDCIGLGIGAGVQCVINVLWEEEWTAEGEAADNGVSSLAPAMIEYGLDPVASKVRYLQVDNQSLAEGAAGVLKGDTVTSRARCANTPAMQLCERVTRIYAPPDGKYVQVTIDMERNHDRVSSLTLDLRRTAPDDAGAAAGVRLPQLPKEQDRTKGKDPPRSRQPIRGAPSAAPSGRGGSRR